MKVRWLLVGSLALGTGLSSGTTTAQRLSVLDLLDRYGGGQFEAVVEKELQSWAGRFALDLSQLGYVGSLGLRTFVSLHRN